MTHQRHLAPTNGLVSSRCARFARWCGSSATGPLERVVPGFAGADPDQAVDGDGPHLAVPDLARPGGLHHHVDDVVDVVGFDEYLELHLRDERHGVLGAPVHLRLAGLAAIALNLAGGHPQDPERPQGVSHVLEAVGLDDRRDEMHHYPSSWPAGPCQNVLRMLYFARASEMFRGHEPEVAKQAARSCATRSTSVRSASAASHDSGTTARPPAAPRRLPVMAPVESESPEWLTAARTAASNVPPVRAQ